MLSARGSINYSSVLGVFLFAVVVGSYGLAFRPESGFFRSLVVLLVFFISFCSLVISVKSFLASALLASYQILVFFSVVLYFLFSFLKGYEFEASRIFLWISASIWAAILWSNVPFLLDWYERSLYFITILTLGLVIFLGRGLEEYTLTSRNYWSFVLVPLLGSLFLLKNIRSERVSVILCFLVFLVAVLTQGRSGIISSGLVLVSSFLYNLRFVSRFSNRVFFLLGLVVVGVLVVCYALINGLLDYALAKGLGDSARYNILYEYFLHLDGFVNYVSGVSVYLIGSASDLNYNLHNTFLYFHSRFGVYFFVIIFLVFFAFLRSFLNGSWVILLVFFSVFLRLSTDSGWGFNSIAIHFLCIFGLGWILNAFVEVEKNSEISLGRL